MSKENKEPSDIAKRVLHNIRKDSLVQEGQTLLVAVSGGPDSVCLLHVLSSLRQKLGINLHAVHLDHQLRGVESEADARYVAELVRRLDIPATVETRDVNSYQKKYRLSPEEAAREVRYAFFSEVAQSIGGDRVAVGHTLDDHVETILLHLIRGSGMQGLTGLQPAAVWRKGVNRLQVVRPLLDITREETMAYCREYGLEPRTDSSNLSRSFLRNRIRLELLPVLQKYNPQIKEALERLSKIAGNEVNYMNSLAIAAWQKTVRVSNNTVVLNKKKFNALDVSIQRYLLRMAIEKVRGEADNPLRDIEEKHIAEMLNALDKKAGKMIKLPYGLVFVVEYDRYLLGTDPAALSPFPPLAGGYRLPAPGKTRAGGWTVKADIGERKDLRKGNAFTACMDFNKAGSDLFVRTYRAGDRFQPLGMSDDKKLGEFMIDARIPHAWRSRIPIVCNSQHIVWVAGYRLDDRVKVTPETDKVLEISFRKIRKPK